MTERLGHFEANINKEIGEFKFGFSKVLTQDFELLNERIEKKLTLINDRVNERLDQNFEKSNKTFMNVLERLNKIDEAQKKIDSLNGEIVSLQGVLTDKKTRGTFGEVNLEYILNNAFGPASGGIYNTQVKFDNGYIVDALLYAPSPLGTISIDSKFPLENYQKMVNRTFTKEQRLAYEKLFVQDVKKPDEIDMTNTTVKFEYADLNMLKRVIKIFVDRLIIEKIPFKTEDSVIETIVNNMIVVIIRGA
jgi:DNA recombination protein RmuC